MADLKIKDAPQAATANATDRLPVSQGTGDAVTVTVAQINTVHEAKLDPHTQYLLESDAAAAYEPKNANIQSHINNTSNPHGVTASQVGAEPANVNIQQHIASTSDPHDTQFDQLGGTLTKLPFNTGLAVQTLSTGEAAWNPDERTLDVSLNGVVGQLFQEDLTPPVKNISGELIPNGTLCMFAGTIGNSGRLLVVPMDGRVPANAMRLLGFATEDIPSDGEGFVTQRGKVRNINTSAWAEQDVLYTSTTVVGGVTNVEPTSGLKQPIAVVINSHATVGTIYARIETLNHLAFEPANTNIQQHISNTSNPHNVTYTQVGAEPANANIQQHISSTSNPHSVTATQVGLGNVLNATQEVISAKGQALGYCPLDGSAKVSETYLPDSVLGQVEYQGVWNATTNTPAIPAASTTNKGWYYIVATSGTTNIDGTAEWTIGDWIVSNGTTWNKVDNTDSVSSVFGRSGAIVANSGDYTASQVTNVPEGSISAVTVQAAINELDAEKLALASLGTGVATALAVNVGTAGAPVVNGGALGTPASGDLRNCSLAVAPAIGGTTPNSGAFTTVSIVSPSDAVFACKSSGSAGAYNQIVTDGVFWALDFRSTTARRWAIGRFGGTTDGLFIYDSTDTARMSITPTGNLLVGTTTDDGVNKLQVSGSIKATGLSVAGNIIGEGVSGLILNGGSSEYVGNVDYLIQLKQPYGSAFGGNGTGILLGARAAGGNENIGAIYAELTNGALPAGDLVFATRNAGTDPVARMKLTSTGNLLIGTTTDRNNTPFVVEKSSSGWCALFRNSPSAAGVYIGSDSTEYARISSVNSDFSAYKALALNPSGGNVLIGTTTDNGVNKLQVNGSISSTGLSVTGSITSVASTGAGSVTLGDTSHYGVISSGGAGSSIYLNGASRVGAGTAAAGATVFATDGMWYWTDSTGSATRMSLSSSSGLSVGTTDSTAIVSAGGLNTHLTAQAVGPDGTVIFKTNGAERARVTSAGLSVTGTISATALPTSDPHVAGAFWRSGNTVMVSTG